MAEELPLRMTADATQGPPLHALGGKPGLKALGQDLQRLNLLPIEALMELYQVLGPMLSGELSSERFRKVSGAYCEKHRVSLSDLVPGVAAARTLLRGAAAEELELEKFVEDLEVLGIEVPVAKALAGGYGRAIIRIRGELMMTALMDHGKVLKHTDWRIDQIRGSNRAKNLNAPVATLSFSYREGQKDKRITLQAIPPVLKQLRDVLDELLTSDEEAAQEALAKARAAAEGG